MLRRSALLLVLVAACGKPTTGAEAPAEDAPTPAPQTQTPTATTAMTDAQPPTADAPTDPSDEGAFARLWLNKPVTLREGVELTLTSVIAETIEASPEDPESYPAGSGVTVAVDVRSEEGHETVEFARLSAGYTSREILWAVGLRLELGVVDDTAISLRVDRVGEPVGAATKLALIRGQAAPLATGVAIRLVAHSHKRTAGGPSPLLVELRYTTEDGHSEEQHLSLLDDRSWRWRDFDFLMTDYEYGERMDVEVRRLRRIPLSLPE